MTLLFQERRAPSSRDGVVESKVDSGWFQSLQQNCGWSVGEVNMVATALERWVDGVVW